MNLDVTLILTIWTKDKREFTTGHRDLSLPFSPFIGMTILNGDFDFGDIKRVLWVEQKNRFACSIDFVHRDPAMEFEYIVGEAKKQGFVGFEEIYEKPRIS